MSGAVICRHELIVVGWGATSLEVTRGRTPEVSRLDCRCVMSVSFVFVNVAIELAFGCAADS